MRRKEFSIEQIKRMKQLYEQEHYSLKKVGEEFNVSRSVITRVFKENNIEINHDNHRYQANYNYFEKIDSKEKAYWLGFLAADGCVYVRPENATISINLNSRDRKHLEKFNNSLNGNYPIKDIITSAGFSNNTPMSSIAVNSKKMAQDLIEKGVVPKKSLILKPPLINKKYYMDYIAGYFDGDGSLGETAQKEWFLNIQGTKEICEWLKECLDWDSPLDKRHKNDKNSFYIRCGGKQKPFKIMSQFYEKSPIHLDRKFEKYNKLKNAVVLSGNI